MNLPLEGIGPLERLNNVDTCNIRAEVGCSVLWFVVVCFGASFGHTHLNTTNNQSISKPQLNKYVVLCASTFTKL